jgi:dCTP deaminase
MLKAERIAELLEDDTEDSLNRLVIVPEPDLGELRRTGAASVDLRLGTWFMRVQPARTTHLSVDEHVSEGKLTKTHYVPFGEKYVLHPGSFVLGVTLEWICLPSTIAGSVIGKSSWGRRGLIIATATGVHPGFSGCLTLELSNVGEIPIEIRPGMTICQLSLYRVEESNAALEGAEASGPVPVAKSRLGGLRKPTLGSVRPDSIAEKLAGGRLGEQ